MALIARDTLLTPAQVAKETGIPVRTIRTWLDTGRIAFEVLPLDRKRTRRIRRSVVVTLIVDRRTA